MPSTPQFDVVVIGAGPSGSRTAELLAADGFSVALFEKDPGTGRPVHCTGIVSAECFYQYQLPRSLIIREVQSFLLRSPRGHGTRIQRNKVQAYVLDRIALDELLAERAVEAGAQLSLNTSVDDLVWNGEGVSLQVTVSGVPHVISARAAVVATGHGGSLARRIGLASVRDVVSGCQAIVEAKDVSEVEVFTGGTLGHGGYGWLVPWRAGYALAGVLTRKYTVRRMDEHIQALQEEGRIGLVQEVFRCRSVPLGVPKHTVLDGVVGVGDAVCQVKPTTGGGIYYGLLGADAAARALGDALRDGDATAKRLAPYEHQWRAIMEPEIQQGYILRRVLEQLPDPVVESLHRLLSLPGLKQVVGSGASFDWHSGPLTRMLAYLQHHHAEAKEAAASQS